MQRLRERADRRPATAGARAFTLVEVLVVIALMAVLSGTIVFGSGMFSSTRLRSAAGLIVTASRLAVTRTNTVGHSVRLVFDIDESRIFLEETSGRMLRVKESSDPKSEGAAAGADPATEAEKQSLEYADGIIKGPHAPRAKFTPIKIASSDSDPAKGRELGKGVKFRLVQTEHDLKPRDKGRAYLYFWPGGGTERAVVQLEREGSEDVLSVLVNPLTARAHIEHGKVDLLESHHDEDFGGREAPTF
jgi:general secretion pathway protein H